MALHSQLGTGRPVKAEVEVIVLYTGLDMPLLLRAVQLLVLYDEQDVRAGVCSVEFFLPCKALVPARVIYNDGC